MVTGPRPFYESYVVIYSKGRSFSSGRSFYFGHDLPFTRHYLPYLYTYTHTYTYGWTCACVTVGW